MCEVFISLKCMSKLIYVAAYEVILNIFFSIKIELDPDFFWLLHSNTMCLYFSQTEIPSFFEWDYSISCSPLHSTPEPQDSLTEFLPFGIGDDLKDAVTQTSFFKANIV